MLMLRSIAPAINLKTAGKYYSSRFLLYFSLASLTSGYLWYSSFTAYAFNNNGETENTIRGLFLFICVELRALLISGPPSRVRKVRSCQEGEVNFAYKAISFQSFVPLDQRSENESSGSIHFRHAP